MFDVKKVRLDFPMLQNKKMQGKNFIYFDNAATSLKPLKVINAEMDYYTNYCSNAHRGDYDFAHQVDEAYELVREKVGRFLDLKYHIDKKLLDAFNKSKKVKDYEIDKEDDEEVSL